MQANQSKRMSSVRLCRSIYASARYNHGIMPHILCEWLETQESGDVLAVKMFLEGELNARWGIPLARGDRENFALGKKLFEEWDAKTPYKVPESIWSLCALTRHITCPWESRYAVMDVAELDEAEDAVFDRWCKVSEKVEDEFEEAEEEAEEEEEEEAEEEEEDEVRTHVLPACSIPSQVLPPCDDFTVIGFLPESVETVEVTAKDELEIGDVLSYCKLCHQASLRRNDSGLGLGCVRLWKMVVGTTPTSISVAEVLLTEVPPWTFWGCSGPAELDVHLNTSATPTTIDIARFGLYGIERVTNMRYDTRTGPQPARTAVPLFVPQM